MAKGLVVATLAVAVLAFVAYPIFLPVPDDVADSPWTLKIATVVLRFVSGIITSRIINLFNCYSTLITFSFFFHPFGYEGLQKIIQSRS